MTGMRAGVAMSGVLPPVPYGDDLLVDGGALNNLPVDEMRVSNPSGIVIAADVAPLSGPRVRFDCGLSVSGWTAI
jgi:predicted acylesterase/phospholipase RssA